MSEFSTTMVLMVGSDPLRAKNSIAKIVDQTLGFREHVQLILIAGTGCSDVVALARYFETEYRENIVLLLEDDTDTQDAIPVSLIKGDIVNVSTDRMVWHTQALERIVECMTYEPDAAVCTAKSDGFPIVDACYSPNVQYLTPSEMVKEGFTNSQSLFFRVCGISGDRIKLTPFLANQSPLPIVLASIEQKMLVCARAIYSLTKKREASVLSIPSIREIQDEIEFLNDGDLRLTDVCSNSIEAQAGIVEYLNKVNDELLAGRHSPEQLQKMAECFSRWLDFVDESVIACRDLTLDEKSVMFSYKEIASGLRSVDSAGRLLLDQFCIGESGTHLFCDLKHLKWEQDTLVFSGVTNLPSWDSRAALILKDDKGRKYYAEVEPYSAADVKNVAGDTVLAGYRFRIAVSGKRHEALQFECETNAGSFVPVVVKVQDTTGLHDYENEQYDHSYCSKDECLVTLHHGSDDETLFSVHPYSTRLHRRLERSFEKELKAAGKGTLMIRRREHYVNLPPLENKVLLFSVRSSSGLQGNLAALKESLDCEVECISRTAPYTYAEIKEIINSILSSKVVVTDDYNSFLRLLGKRPGQVYVQTWHAAGAFKKFGLDGTSLLPEIDAAYHENYDLVTVSSESVRPIYAKAFSVPLERVKALGLPRTDMLFDDRWIAESRDRILGTYPELLGKRVILYAPTFRGAPGPERAHFVPDLDFDKLSANLAPDQMLVVCPHPVMTAPILDRQYPNILEIRDFTTQDMFSAADLLVTDYSSVIFEYALFDKPIAFYCYDLDTYDKDFYLKYPDDLPGPCFNEQEALTDYLIRQDWDSDKEKRSHFVSVYMSTCDGGSSERVSEYILQRLAGKEKMA